MSNIFCKIGDDYYYSWDPANLAGCNIMTVQNGILYGFSKDMGQTWEYRPSPIIPAGPYDWDGAAIETAFPLKANDTLYVFYSSRGLNSTG